MRHILVILILLLFVSPVVAQTVITAGNDTTVCLGDTATLNAKILSGSYGTTSYTFEIISYLPEPFSGGTPVVFASNQDDQIAGPFDIGFTFCFFNQTYTQFYIGSNGWVGFSFNTAWTTWTAQPIPTTNPIVPKNCIMAPWEDWWPGFIDWGNTSDTNVFYYVTGTAPNRKLVVYWLNCPLYNCPTEISRRGTFQIVLNEQNSIVENNIQKKPDCASPVNATQGVHNQDGTEAFTAEGRNCTAWTANDESTRFVPSGIRWYTGGYPGGTVVGYGPTLIISPTVTTTYTAAVETCDAGVATDDVTVTVMDATFAYSSPTYCNSDPDPVPTLLQTGGAFSASPPGISFISTSTGEIDLSVSLPGSYTITRTITASCTVSYSQNVTVIASPAEPVPAEDTVNRCGPGTVTLSVNQNPGEEYSWYDAPAGGTLLYTGPVITVSVTDTVILYVESKTIASTCISLIRAQVVTVARAIPDVIATPAATAFCSGLTTNIALSSTLPGSTFEWSVTDNPNVTGDIPGPFNINPIAQTLLINPGIYTQQDVTYHITALNDGCVSPTIDTIITVHPVPNITNSTMSSGLCSGSTLSVSLTSDVAATTFSWTFTDNPNVTGEQSGNGTVFTQTLTNAGFNPETVLFHITPSSPFGCTGETDTFSVFVVTTPDIYFVPATQSLCSGAISDVEIHSQNPSATFTWVSAPVPNPPDFYGWSDGAGNLIQQTLYNNTSAPLQVTYIATPETAGCPPGTPDTIVVTVNPIPSITNTDLTDSICSGVSTDILPIPDIPATSFTWTSAVTSGTITGNGSGGPLPPPPIQDLLINTGLTTGVVTYAVTPMAYTCPGIPVSFSISVWPVADVIFNPNGEDVCSGGSTNISLTSGVVSPPPAYAWTASYSGTVSGPLSGSGTPLIATLSNPGLFPGTATFTVTPSVNGCPGIGNSVIVNVNPLPPVTFTPCFDSVVSVNAQPVVLKGAVPYGGTYSGTGVAAGAFYPSVAGPGNHRIYYDYPNAWSCSGRDSAMITVADLSLIPFTCGNNLTDIRDNKSYPTVLINGRCWFSVNLNYGNNISSALMQLDNCAPEKYCFGDNAANCTSFGGMYQWDEMMQYTSVNGAQGFCPPEWHVATEADWQILLTAYSGPGMAGSPLKYTGFSGFDAFFSGMRFNNVTWRFDDFAAMFWTSDSHGSRKAWAHGMNEYNPSVSLYPSHRNNAFFVRCVRD